ncbi:unnamed protein product [Phytomonas sp. EM1]|nr:unnamed protein product [Phytomonas sp. EM1]|eukprot:CCW64525.1 unnamed protein product [Phytomonas sp. isolate EM1]
MPLDKTLNAPKYSIIEKMAAGSFGVVFKIKRLSDNTTMVMKRIPLEDLDRDQRHEAAKELSLISELHHPYIVAQRDAFLFDENDLCLVMDYYDGGDLDYLLARQRDKDEYFDFEQVMLWFVQMLLALDYLHSHGIVHRDVKTHNLFLNQASNTIAVGDFGIAEKVDFSSAKKDAGGTAVFTSSLLPTTERPQWRESGGPHHYHTVEHQHSGLPSPSTNNSEGVVGSPHHVGNGGSRRPEIDITLPNHAADDAARGGASESSRKMVRSPMRIAVKGTPLYMPPEALQGMSYGPKSDVWSLGCILYELLSLRHPFDSTDIGGLIVRVMMGDREPLPSHYPRIVSELIDATLTLECAKRPSCDELLHTPLVSAYVSRLLELRGQARLRDAGSKGGDDGTPECAFKKTLTGLQDAKEAEDALQSQLRRIYGSLHHDSTVSKEGPHATMCYLECAQQLKKPLHPPSYDCERVHRGRRTASMLVQLMSGSSACPTDVLSNLDNTTPRTFPTGSTPPSPELIPGVDPARPPSDHVEGRQTTDAGPPAPRNASLAGGTPLKGRAADDEDGRPKRAPCPGPDAVAPTAGKSSIGGVFVEYSNVDDMRDQPLSVLAAEVLWARALLQRALFERQRRRDAERLLLDVGPHLVTAMPQTFKGVTTTVSDTAPSPARRPTEESGQRTAAPILSSDLASSLSGAELSNPTPSEARGYYHPGEMRWEVDLATRARAAADARLQAYLDRRAALLRLILEELPATTMSRVYAYYREHNIFVRDPSVVLGLVPTRKQWRVLPLIEDVVVLDKFLEQSANHNDDETGTVRTVSSGQVSF